MADDTSPLDANRRALERQLAALAPADLVALLGRLAGEIPDVDRRVRDFLLRDRPSTAAKQARARLRATLARGPDFSWEGAATVAGRLDEILDLIENAILPHDASEAFALLRKFIESDGAALASADDSNGEIGDRFHRACELFARAAAQMPEATAREAWEELITGNHYGCRDALADLAAKSLPAPALEQLIAKLRETIRTGDERAFSASVTLMGIACGKADPELYAEAAYRGQRKEQVPAVALGVVRQFLAAGRPREAAGHMPNSAQSCGGYADQWHEVRVELARALADMPGLRAALWERFCFAPSAAALEQLLAAEPPAEQELRRQSALDFVRSDHRDFEGKLRLLVAAGEVAEAARIAVREHNKLNGDLYYSLVPLAERFEAEEPLAATAVYRALLDSILRRAKPKPYPHGAAYWHRLEKLAARIPQWGPLRPHEAYAAALRTDHGRKHAFWREVKQHDPAAWAREREERRMLLAEALGSDFFDEEDLD